MIDKWIDLRMDGLELHEYELRAHCEHQALLTTNRQTHDVFFGSWQQ